MNTDSPPNLWGHLDTAIASGENIRGELSDTARFAAKQAPLNSQVDLIVLSPVCRGVISSRVAGILRCRLQDFALQDAP